MCSIKPILARLLAAAAASAAGVTTKIARPNFHYHGVVRVVLSLSAALPFRDPKSIKYVYIVRPEPPGRAE